MCTVPSNISFLLVVVDDGVTKAGGARNPMSMWNVAGASLLPDLARITLELEAPATVIWLPWQFVFRSLNATRVLPC